MSRIVGNQNYPRFVHYGLWSERIEVHILDYHEEQLSLQPEKNYSIYDGCRSPITACWALLVMTGSKRTKNGSTSLTSYGLTYMFFYFVPIFRKGLLFSKQLHFVDTRNRPTKNVMMTLLYLCLRVYRNCAHHQTKYVGACVLHFFNTPQTVITFKNHKIDRPPQIFSSIYHADFFKVTRLSIVYMPT